MSTLQAQGHRAGLWAVLTGLLAAGCVFSGCDNGHDTAAPTGLTATVVSSGRIDLGWTDRFGDEDGFEVQRAVTATPTESDYVRIARLAADSSGYSDTSVSASTTYTYRVLVVRAGTVSAWAQEVTATTPAAGGGTPGGGTPGGGTPGGGSVGVSPLGAPSDLTATAVSHDRIDLSWTDNASAELGFRLDRGPSAVAFEGLWVRIATLPADATSYSDTGRKTGSTYAYRLVAYNASGQSSLAGPVEATTFSHVSLVYTASSSVVPVGAASAEFRVERRDRTGNAATAGDLTLVLATSAATGRFDVNAAGAFDGSVSTLVIPDGASTASFYYKDTATGPVSIAASEGSMSVSRNVLVSSASLAFVTSPGTVAAGAPSSEIRVERRDALGQPDTAGQLSLELSTDTGTGAFDTTPGGAFDGSVTTLSIANGQSSLGFYFRDTQAGTRVITVSVSGASSSLQVSQSWTVTVGAPDSLALATPPAPVAEKNRTWDALQVHVRDAFGNLCTQDDTTQVTATFAAGATGTLSGTTTRTASQGRVTFDDLSYDVSEPVQLVVQAAGLTGATSDTVTVIDALATPANLQALAAFRGVSLAWDPVSYATGYRVSWSDASGPRSATFTEPYAHLTVESSSHAYSLAVAALSGSIVSGEGTIPVSTPSDPVTLRAWFFESRTPPQAFSRAGVAGDVDGDGADDVVFYNHVSDVGRNVQVRTGPDNRLLLEFSLPDYGSTEVSVGRAGDVDGDGRDDLLVTVPDYDPPGLSNAGLVELYSGAGGKLLCRIVGYQAFTELGHAACTAGDLNGDGRDDILVSAWLGDWPYPDTGDVWAYSGYTGRRLFGLHGEAAGDRFGTSLAFLGDINGDGVGDFVVGAQDAEPAGGGLFQTGAVYAYSGRGTDLIFKFYGTVAGQAFGQHIAAAGDVDGDGVGDILVGCPLADTGPGAQHGQVFLYSGATGDLIKQVDGPPVGWTGAGEGLNLGGSLARGGDFDGDGLDDMFVGAPGKESVCVLSAADGRQLYAFQRPVAGSGFGWWIAGPDLNGDGTADLLVHQQGVVAGNYGNETFAYTFPSRTPYVVSPAPVPAGGTRLLRPVGGTPPYSYQLTQDRSNGAGVDGTGRYTAGPSTGVFDEVRVTDAPGQSVDVHIAVLAGGVPLVSRGYSIESYGGAACAIPSADGDELPDVVFGLAAGRVWAQSGVTGNQVGYNITRPAATRFGAAVASFGAVSLYSAPPARFAVGAPLDNPGGRVDSGSATMYTGSSVVGQAFGVSAGDRFGSALAGVGDVDADGVSDLLVGAPGASPDGKAGAGSAYVVSGATGGFVLQFDGAAAGDGLGNTLAGPGDLDGDGRSDLAVGAPGARPGGRTDAGTVYVYRGATGLVLRRFDGSGAGDRLGAALSADSDLDGDGSLDLILGAPGRDTVYLYSGATGTLIRAIAGPVPGQGFGAAVAGPGDVDGDHRPDVAVGTTAGDTVYLYSGADGSLLEAFGGPSGDSAFGKVLAGLGDINGDGRGELAVVREHLQQDYTTVYSWAGASRPLAPTRLAASESTAQLVELSFRDNSADETDFQVEGRMGPTGAWFPVQTLAAQPGTGSVTLTVPHYAAGKVVTYRIRAMTAVASSDWSNQVRLARSK